MSNEPAPPRIIMSGEGSKGVVRSAPAGAWQVLAIVGWVFLVVGGMDVALVWYPPLLGNPGWEFGSITTALNGFPLPVMGTSLILASAVARGHLGTARLAMVVASIFVLFAVVAAGFYALDVPIALKEVTEPMGRTGLKKAILRTIVQLIAYPLVLVFVIFRARRLLKTGDA